MASVGVCNYWPKEVRICDLATVGFGGAHALFTLFTVVEQLGQEELVNFIWNSVLKELVGLIKGG